MASYLRSLGWLRLQVSGSSAKIGFQSRARRVAPPENRRGEKQLIVHSGAPAPRPRRRLRGRAAATAGLLCAAVTVASCGWSGSPESPTASSDLLTSLSRAGLPVRNALDTTSHECRTVGCAQAVVTDTVRITSFPTTGQAKSFAASRGLYQAGKFVVAFAPPLTEAERVPYRTAIGRFAH